jgi:glyoxylase-like metal-dependent hydrolase (beta-lactamase superfamily II)/rhodanese-related sulfurtransferase
MHFEPFYLRCLAHASYLVGDDEVCAVVDPQRDVQIYLDAADEEGLRIAHVIETHLHADFVSGHVELARRTGATIHLGHRAEATFPHHALHDGDEIVMGPVRLRVLETPGHTPESVCVLVFDEEAGEQPVKVLTGDTLFIGDVGRPDLAGGRGYTSEQMAGMLYDSLHEKLLTLPDTVEVHPAHGAGSACGKAISSELSSTLGEQRATNLALQPMSREAFVAMMTSDLPPAPAYFPASAELNRRGAPALDELPPPPALDPPSFAALQQQGVLVLDVRDAATFGAGHVPGSVNIGLGGHFASWVGTVLPVGCRLALVADDRDGVDEAVMRLARVGYHEVAGWLEGGLPAWEGDGRPVGRLAQIAPADLAARLGADDAPLVLDVRRPGEHEAGHVAGVVHVPLQELEARVDEVAAARADGGAGRPLAVVCAAGYRSSIAASLLARHGQDDLVNVVGGMNAWRQAGLPVQGAAPA